MQTVFLILCDQYYKSRRNTFAKRMFLRVPLPLGVMVSVCWAVTRAPSLTTSRLPLRQCTHWKAKHTVKTASQCTNMRPALCDIIEYQHRARSTNKPQPRCYYLFYADVKFLRLDTLRGWGVVFGRKPWCPPCGMRASIPQTAASVRTGHASVNVVIAISLSVTGDVGVL